MPRTFEFIHYGNPDDQEGFSSNVEWVRALPPCRTRESDRYAATAGCHCQ